ncbi:GTP-binding protein [Streptomyces sp. NPDC050560]|uniref:GTP-binding protein n=1 Tax=Streptomyces sp. NPDC050560 TaxID=3365630 RepID=UPI0037A7D61F
MSRSLNLGILAHVDAGKTSLTERLLHLAGVIPAVGSVDEGSTTTDTLALERERGITIRSAVVSFAVDGVTVNLIDTPGHSDFIAEVERVLDVLDGAVLVVSAVEGVQAQTRVLMRTLRRLGIPTLIFVNKIDRGGADPGRVLGEIATALTPAVVAMGDTARTGTRRATARPYGRDDTEFTGRVTALLGEHDDAFLTAYVLGETPPYPLLRSELARHTRRLTAHPVFFGSAVTGAGVDALTAGLTELLPTAGGAPDAAASGTVFKIERGPAGEKVAYVRMFSGTARIRALFRYGPPGEPRGEEKITGIGVFERGGCARADAVQAGRIARVRGLGGTRIGDLLWAAGEGGAPQPPERGGGAIAAARRGHFSPPTLETVVVPGRAADRGRLYAALAELAEQDPLINVRRAPDGEIFVSLYGEVQKEVVQATLAADHGVAATFRESVVVHVERLTGTGEAAEFNGAGGNPFLATVGLRVEPGEPGGGVRFRLGVELGSMPYAFFKATEDTVRESLQQGLCGWRVVDCTVTMTHSGYSPRQSHAHARFDKSMSSTGADFRGLTPLVLFAALRRAGTRVHEPLHRFSLDVPADCLDAVLPVLARLRALPDSTVARGASYQLEGEIPAARVHGLQRQLPSLTRGEGALEYSFDHYAPVYGAPPGRARTDADPLRRREYLLRVLRGVRA